jgi:tetratricopeptide (TPR) repeat protein
VPVELNDSYEAIYQRAISQITLGDTEAALESLWRIVHRLTRLRPETLQRKENLLSILLTTWSSLVQFLRWEKRYDTAIHACEAVINHLPRDQGIDRRVASLMIERGDITEGLARMRQIVEQAPSLLSWADLGAEYTALRDYQEAESCYRSAIALAESNQEAAIANTGLFRVYRETGDVDAALNAWSMVVVLDPDMGDHVSEVYTWLIERGDLEQAGKYLRREREPVRRTFYQGLLHWQAGRHDKARAQWQTVLDMDVKQDNADIAAWIEAALRLGDPARALGAEETLSDGKTTLSIDAVIGLGIAHAMLDQVAAAKAQFDQVIRRLQRGWPATDKIETDRWELFQSLVTNQETVQALAHYFDVGDDKD